MESVLTNESEISLNQTIETLHNLRVAHTGWQEILDEFDDLITFAPYSNEGVGMMIIGESGVGKTTLLKAIKARFPEAQQRDDRSLVPCPLISIPSRPTIKSVAQATLAALGDPLAGVGGQTTVELTSRIVCLAKGCESRALLFDEANHFVVRKARRLTSSDIRLVQRTFRSMPDPVRSVRPPEIGSDPRM